MMSIRCEDRLDGISNYIPWKVRITAILKEWKIWRFANSIMTKPTYKDALEEHEALEARAQRVTLDGVKDHLIPHLAEKKTTKEMWDTLNDIYIPLYTLFITSYCSHICIHNLYFTRHITVHINIVQQCHANIPLL